MIHRTDINLILPIGPNGSYRLRSEDDKPLPGAMVPAEAVNWLQELRKGGKNILSIGLCGPGDVLSSWTSTLACLELLQAEKKDAKLLMSTLGLTGTDKVPTLVEMGVDQVNLQVQTVSLEKALALYSWIRPGKKTLPLKEGAALLIQEQKKFCMACAEVGIAVCIETLVEKDQDEVEQVAKTMAGYGATQMVLRGEDVDLASLAERAAPFLQAVVADSEPALPPPGTPSSCTESSSLPKPVGDRNYVAVVSSSGMDVDLHLGQASQLLIYGKRDDGLACLLETRVAPSPGDDDRWAKLAETLSDCFCLLASHAGEAPRSQLAAAGISILLTTGQIEGIVDTLYGGGKKKKCKK